MVVNPELVYKIPAWSISVELALYLLFPLLMLLYRTAGTATIFLIISVGFFVLETLTAKGLITSGIWTENFSPLRGLPTSHWVA